MGIAERWKKFRPLPADIMQRLEHLIPLFEREGVVLAYLFGSLSQGRPAQDIDLALYTRDIPVFRLRAAITECLGTERIDLVDLKRASPVLRFEIIRTGQPLYVADALFQERFELETIHLYRDTAPLRRQQREYLKRRMRAWSSEEKQLKND
jgi:predicted nucleotidyltransferase